MKALKFLLTLPVSIVKSFSFGLNPPISLDIVSKIPTFLLAPINAIAPATNVNPLGNFSIKFKNLLMLFNSLSISPTKPFIKSELIKFTDSSVKLFFRLFTLPSIDSIFFWFSSYAVPSAFCIVIIERSAVLKLFNIAAKTFALFLPAKVSSNSSPAVLPFKSSQTYEISLMISYVDLKVVGSIIISTPESLFMSSLILEKEISSKSENSSPISFNSPDAPLILRDKTFKAVPIFSGFWIISSPAVNKATAWSKLFPPTSKEDAERFKPSPISAALRAYLFATKLNLSTMSIASSAFNLNAFKLATILSVALLKSKSPTLL